MKENLSSLLKEYGLDDKEIKVYLYLVSRKRLTAYQIAKDTKILRSNCYNILNRLIEKGFVSVSEEENKKLFSTNDLEKALGHIKNKESILLSIIPEINKIEEKEETYVKYSDDRHSFAQIDTKVYELAMNKKITFFYMISNSPDLTTQSSRLLVARMLKDFAATKALENIDGRAIWDRKFKKDPFMKSFAKLGKNRLLDKLPNKSTTFIYDEHIAFVFLSEQGNYIEIKNRQVSEEMKAYFEYLWKMSKE